MRAMPEPPEDYSQLRRVPPHSVESEESVLGAMLMSTDAVNEVMDKLEADDFYVPAHRSIYGAVKLLFNTNQAIDAITVSEELRRQGELEKVGGVPYVTRLLDVVPSASNVDYYAGIVEETSQRRHLIRAGSTITEDVPADVLTISRVRQKNLTGWKRPKKAAKSDKAKQ